MPSDWGPSYVRGIVVALSGAPGDGVAADDSFLLLINAWEPLSVRLPAQPRSVTAGLEVGSWSLLLLRGGPSSRHDARQARSP
jgi:hypothetical protein